MKKVAIFASGNGSNFEALISSNEINKLADINLLICDNPNAKVIDKAKKYNIEKFIFNPKDYISKKEYEDEILSKVQNIDIIFLAGYMRIISKNFLEKFNGKIINIHPSLLPKYKGVESIKRAYENKEEYIGVSIHYVNEEIDGGKIIAQEKFKVDYNKSLEEIIEEVHKIEHKLYIKTAIKILKEEL